MTLKTRNKGSKLDDLLKILLLLIRCIAIVIINGLMCVIKSFCACGNFKWKNVRDDKKETAIIKLKLTASKNSEIIPSRTLVNAKRPFLKKANQSSIKQVRKGEKRKVLSCRDRNYSNLRPPLQELNFTKEDVWTFRNGTSGPTQARVRVYSGNSLKCKTIGGRNNCNNVKSHSTISFSPRGLRKSVQTGSSNAKLLKKEFPKHCNSGHGWLQNGKQTWPLKASCKCCGPFFLRSNFATLSLARNCKELQLQAAQERRLIPLDFVAKLKGNDVAKDQYSNQVETWKDNQTKCEIECNVTPYPDDCGKNSVIPQEPIGNRVAISGALSSVSLSTSNNVGSPRLSMSRHKSEVHSPRAKGVNTGVLVKSLSQRKSLALKPCSVLIKDEASSNSSANAGFTPSPLTCAPVVVRHLASSRPIDVVVKEEDSPTMNANPRFSDKHLPAGSGEEKREQVVSTCLVTKDSPVLTTHVRGHSTSLRHNDGAIENHAISLPNCPHVTARESLYSDENDVISFEDVINEEKAPTEIERPSSDAEKSRNFEKKSGFDIIKDPIVAQIVSSSIIDSEVDALAELIGKLSIENSPKIESTQNCECLKAAELKDGDIFMASLYPEQPPTLISGITNYIEQRDGNNVQNLQHPGTFVTETPTKQRDAESNTAIKFHLNYLEPSAIPRTTFPMTITVGRQEAVYVATFVNAELPSIQPDVRCTFPEHAQGDVKNNCFNKHNEQEVKLAGKNYSEYSAEGVAKVDTEPMIVNLPFARQSTAKPDIPVNAAENPGVKRCTTNGNSDLSNAERTQDPLREVSLRCLDTTPEVEYGRTLGQQALLQFNPVVYTLYPYNDSDMQTNFGESFSEEKEADLYTVQQVSLPVTVPAIASEFSTADEQRPQFDTKKNIYSEHPFENVHSGHDLIDRSDRVHATVQQTLFKSVVENLEESPVLSQMAAAHNGLQHGEGSASSKHLNIGSNMDFDIIINNQLSPERSSDSRKVAQTPPPTLSSQTPGPVPEPAATAATTTSTAEKAAATTTTTMTDDKWKTRSEFIVPLFIGQIITEVPFLDSDWDDNHNDDCEEGAETIGNVTRSNVTPESHKCRDSP